MFSKPKSWFFNVFIFLLYSSLITFKYNWYHLIYDQPGLEYVILGGPIVR
jgi:hypothetical protein